MIQSIKLDEIRRLIEEYGKRESITICMEEAAEYIQALSKMLRITDWEKEYQQCRRALIEEIADTLISIRMSLAVYNISDEEVEKEVERKMKRNLNRIDK